MEIDKDLAARQEARLLCRQAEKAQKILSTFPQEKLDRIVEAMARAFSAAAVELAELAQAKVVLVELAELLEPVDLVESVELVEPAAVACRLSLTARPSSWKTAFCGSTQPTKRSRITPCPLPLRRCIPPSGTLNCF